MNKSTFLTALILSSTYCFNGYSSDLFNDDDYNEQTKKTLNNLHKNIAIQFPQKEINLDLWTEWNVNGSSILTKEKLLTKKDNIIEDCFDFIKSFKQIKEILNKEKNRKKFWEETEEDIFKERLRYIAESFFDCIQNKRHKCNNIKTLNDILKIHLKKNQKKESSIQHLENMIQNSLKNIDKEEQRTFSSNLDYFFQYYAKKFKIDMTDLYSIYKKKTTQSDVSKKRTILTRVHYIQDLCEAFIAHKEIEKMIGPKYVNHFINGTTDCLLFLVDDFLKYKKQSNEKGCIILEEMFTKDFLPSLNKFKSVLQKHFYKNYIDYQKKVVSLFDKKSPLNFGIDAPEEQNQLKEHPFKEILPKYGKFYSSFLLKHSDDKHINALSNFYKHTDFFDFVLKQDLNLEFYKIIYKTILEVSKDFIEESIIFRRQFLEKNLIHVDSYSSDIWEKLLQEQSETAFTVFKKQFKNFYDNHIENFYDYTQDSNHYMSEQIKKTHAICAALFPIVSCYGHLVTKFDEDQSIGKMILNLLDRASILGDSYAIEQYLIMAAHMKGIVPFTRILHIATTLAGEKLFNDPIDLTYYNEIALLVPLYVFGQEDLKKSGSLFMLYLKKHLNQFQKYQLESYKVIENNDMRKEKHIPLSALRDDVLQLMENYLFYFNTSDENLKDLPHLYECIMIALSKHPSKIEEENQSEKIIDLIKKIPIKLEEQERYQLREAVIGKEKTNPIFLETASFFFAQQRTIQVDCLKKYQFDQESINIILLMQKSIKEFSNLFSVFIDLPPLIQKNHLDKEFLSDCTRLGLASILSRELWSKKYILNTLTIKDHFNFLLSFFSWHFCSFSQHEDRMKQIIFSSDFERNINQFCLLLSSEVDDGIKEKKLDFENNPNNDLIIIGNEIKDVICNLIKSSDQINNEISSIKSNDQISESHNTEENKNPLNTFVQMKIGTFLSHLKKIFQLYTDFTELKKLYDQVDETIAKKTPLLPKNIKKGYIKKIISYILDSANVNLTSYQKHRFDILLNRDYIDDFEQLITSILLDEVKYFNVATLKNLIESMASSKAGLNIKLDQEHNQFLLLFLKEKNEKNFSHLLEKTNETLEKLQMSYKEALHHKTSLDFEEKKSICAYILHHFTPYAELYGSSISSFDKEGLLLKTLIDTFNFGAQFGNRECLKMYLGLILEDRVVEQTPLNFIMNILQVLKETKNIEVKGFKKISSNSMEFNVMLNRLLKIVGLDPNKTSLPLEQEIKTHLLFLEEYSQSVLTDTISIKDNMKKIDEIEKSLKEELSLSVLNWPELSDYKRCMEEKKIKTEISPKEQIFLIYTNLLSFIYKKMSFSKQTLKNLKKETIIDTILFTASASDSENIILDKNEEYNPSLVSFLSDKNQETFSFLLDQLNQFEVNVRQFYKDLIRGQNEEDPVRKKKIYSYIVKHVLHYASEYEKLFKSFDKDALFLNKLIDILSFGAYLGSRDCLKAYLDCLVDDQIIQQTESSFIFKILNVLEETQRIEENDKESKKNSSNFVKFNFILKRLLKMLDIEPNKRLSCLSQEIDDQLHFLEKQTEDILKGVHPLQDYIALINEKDRFLRDQLLGSATSWNGLKAYKITLEEKEKTGLLTEQERILLIYAKLVLHIYEKENIQENPSNYIFLNGYDHFVSHYSKLCDYYKNSIKESQKQEEEKKKLTEKNLEQLELFNAKNKKISSIETKIKDLNKKIEEQSNLYKNSQKELKRMEKENQDLKNILQKKDEKTEALEKQLSIVKQKLVEQEKSQKEAVLKENQKKQKEWQKIEDTSKKQKIRIQELFNEVNQKSFQTKELLKMNEKLTNDLDQKEKENKMLSEDLKDFIDFFVLTTEIEEEKNAQKCLLENIIRIKEQLNLCISFIPVYQENSRGNKIFNLDVIEKILKNKEEIILLINNYRSLTKSYFDVGSIFNPREQAISCGEILIEFSEKHAIKKWLYEIVSEEYTKHCLFSSNQQGYKIIFWEKDDFDSAVKVLVETMQKNKWTYDQIKDFMESIQKKLYENAKNFLKENEGPLDKFKLIFAENLRNYTCRIILEMNQYEVSLRNNKSLSEREDLFKKNFLFFKEKLKKKFDN